MRNLSMKKFGTPIGAGPGSASDVDGFVSVGTPCRLRSAVRVASALVELVAGAGAPPVVLVDVACLRPRIVLLAVGACAAPPRLSSGCGSPPAGCGAVGGCVPAGCCAAAGAA